MMWRVPRTRRHPRHPAGEGVGADRPPVDSGEYEIALSETALQPFLGLPGLVLAQYVEDAGGQHDRALPPLRLVGLEPQPVFGLLERAHDLDDAGRQVDVLPAERQQFAAPEPGGERQDDRDVDPGGRRRGEQLPSLLALSVCISRFSTFGGSTSSAGLTAIRRKARARFNGRLSTRSKCTTV
jgi:hypothetical protein